MDISKFCILTLDGPNWGQWYERFQSSTRINNIWDAIRWEILTPAPNLTRDLLAKPSPPTGTATAAELATYNAAKTLWSQKNSQGLGLIPATISNVIWQRYESLTPETLNVLYLERNLIFSSIKNLTTFWILPDVRNWEQKQILI